jgi:hypothetical protein
MALLVSLEADARVANAENVARPQQAFADALAVHVGAARTAPVREQRSVRTQDHLAVEHGNVRVFQARGGTHVTADKQWLLFLERKDATAVTTGEDTKLMSHRSFFRERVGIAPTEGTTYASGL